MRSLISIWTAALSLGCASLLASVSAKAETIDITYTLSGSPTITAVTATTAYLSGTITGSFDEADPAVDAMWNPVSFTFMDQVNLANGLLTGAFTATLADGDTVSGIVNEDLAAILSSPTLTGTYTQVLTFMGGTGEFAGVSGSASGVGSEGVDGSTVSGSGTLTVPEAIAPEPASLELMLGGVGFLAVGYPRRRVS